MNVSSTSRLVWIDLEMTGLDPRRDAVLEIATLVTDAELDLIAEGPSLVIHQPDETLERMNSIVREMHDRNGLTEKVRESKLSLEDAEARTIRFLQQHCEPRKAPLCGNTIWMDRAFLLQHMPRIHEYLHYRVIDVSSLKELARRWDPSVLATLPAKPETHRALDDIRASIDELRHYRKNLILAPQK